MSRDHIAVPGPLAGRPVVRLDVAKNDPAEGRSNGIDQRAGRSDVIASRALRVLPTCDGKTRRGSAAG